MMITWRRSSFEAQSDQTMLQARLKKNGVFQELIHHLKDQIRADVNLCFSPNVLELNFMHPSHTWFLALQLDPNLLFDSYQCSEAVDLGLNPRVLSHVLNNITTTSDDDMAAIRLLTNCAGSTGEAGDLLILLSEKAESIVDYDIQLAHVLPELWGPPDDETVSCSVTMPAEEFQRILSGFEDDDGNTCLIRFTREGIMFSTFGNGGRCTKSLELRCDPSDDIDNSDEFSLRSLKCFATTASLAKNVTLRLYQNYSLVIDFEIEEITSTIQMKRVGSLKYYLTTNDESDPPLPAALPTRYEEESAAEARLINGKLFAKIIEIVRLQVGEAILCLSYNGIYIHGMHIVFPCPIRVDMNLSSFDYYRCNEELSLGINLNSIFTTLRHMRHDDILSLIAEEDRLLLRLESPSKNEITVRGTFC